MVWNKNHWVFERIDSCAISLCLQLLFLFQLFFCSLLFSYFHTLSPLLFFYLPLIQSSLWASRDLEEKWQMHMHTNSGDLGWQWRTSFEDLGMVLAFYFLEAVFNKGTLLGRLHLFIAYRTNADTERDRWTDRTNRHSNKVGRKAKTWLGRQADKHTNIQQFVRIQGM